MGHRVRVFHTDDSRQKFLGARDLPRPHRTIVLSLQHRRYHHFAIVTFKIWGVMVWPAFGVYVPGPTLELRTVPGLSVHSRQSVFEGSLYTRL